MTKRQREAPVIAEYAAGQFRAPLSRRKPRARPRTFGLHWTDRKTGSTFYLADARTVRSFTSIAALVRNLRPRDTVRVCRANPADHFLLTLHLRMGLAIECIHWHRLVPEDKKQEPDSGTGDAPQSKTKKLSAKEIAARLIAAEPSAFVTLAPDIGLANLRSHIAFLQQYQHMRTALERIVKGRYLPEYVQANRDRFARISFLKKEINKDIRLIEANVARYLPSREKQLFAAVAAMKDPAKMAARLHAAFAGIGRFRSVGAMWRFAGLDGPRATAGKNTRIKAIMASANWLRHGSLWRACYDAYRQQIALRHPAASKGHIHNMARRRMWKEILKRWYLKVKGIDFEKGAVATPSV